MTYWVEFHNRPSGCVHASSEEEAKAKASEHGAVKQVHNLPYGAHPALDGGRPGDFCFQPEKCKGHTSCPRPYACSE